MKLSLWKDGEEPAWVGNAILFLFFGPAPVAIVGALLGFGPEILRLVGFWVVANLLFGSAYLSVQALLRREWADLPLPLCFLIPLSWMVGKYLGAF